jgi:hypothetical protein
LTARKRRDVDESSRDLTGLAEAIRAARMRFHAGESSAPVPQSKVGRKTRGTGVQICLAELSDEPGNAFGRAIDARELPLEEY